jgi:ADP-ribose pyrophosphatase
MTDGNQKEPSEGEDYGPWKIVKKNRIYDDPWISVRMDQVVRPDGNPGTYSTVRIKSGVCVIPIDELGNVYLTREFHYAVGMETIEGVSGGIEIGESAECTAKRELREEIGILAGHLHELGKVDPLTASLCSPTTLFLATDLTMTHAAPEGTERIERIAIPFQRAVEMVINSEITHGPTCTAILKIHVLKSMETPRT